MRRERIAVLERESHTCLLPLIPDSTNDWGPTHRPIAKPAISTQGEGWLRQLLLRYPSTRPWSNPPDLYCSAGGKERLVPEERLTKQFECCSGFLTVGTNCRNETQSPH
jgi:hypothetical protein